MIMDNIIKFDPSDWNTIRDTIDSIIQAGEMQYGRTEDNEPISYDLSDDDTLHTTVIQNNGLVRENWYHIEDHTVEETYHK